MLPPQEQASLKQNMERVKISIEYPLASKSLSIVWGMIGDATGLQKWIADYAEDDGDEITFKWGEPWKQQDVRVSKVLKAVKNKYIRLRWVDDNEEGEYWELRLEKSELTGELTLVITDFADEDDVENMYQIWDDNLDKLHQVSGL